ncbi:MAG: hypothetical protein ABSH16_06305, partial [Sedimentisphaerales bacterium]
GTGQDCIFLSQVVVGLDVLFNEFVEFGDLVIEGSEHFSDAFANPGMKDGLASIQFLDAQVGRRRTRSANSSI